MNLPPRMDPSERLDGWKRIADWLGKSIKTAQRWEEDRGLPIHRIGGDESGGASVFAFVSELEEWLRRDGDAPKTPDFDGARATSATRTVAGLFAGAGCVALLVVVWGGMSPPGNPVATAIEDRHILRVFDAAGGELWRRLIEWPVNAFVGEPGRNPVAVLDLDGDGRNEIVLAQRETSNRRGRLLGFSAEGDTLWEYRVGARLRLDGIEYANKFALWDVLPLRAGGRLLLAAIGRHHPEFPNLVVWLDGATGAEIGSYLHAGYLFATAAVDTDGDGDQELLFGGYNNLLDRPVIGILEPAELDAVSPGPRQWSEGLVAGRERAYVALERSLIGERLGFTSWIRRLTTTDRGFTFEVRLEADIDRHERVYLFEKDLRLLQVEMHHEFRGYYDELVSLGRIDHSFGEEEAAAARLHWLVDNREPSSTTTAGR